MECFMPLDEVSEALTPEEISEIISDVQIAVSKNIGLDYLQVFKNEKGQKIFVIDQLTNEEDESGDFSPDDNYATVLFAEEY